MHVCIYICVCVECHGGYANSLEMFRGYSTSIQVSSRRSPCLIHIFVTFDFLVQLEAKFEHIHRKKYPSLISVSTAIQVCIYVFMHTCTYIFAYIPRYILLCMRTHDVTAGDIKP